MLCLLSKYLIYFEDRECIQTQSSGGGGSQELEGNKCSTPGEDVPTSHNHNTQVNYCTHNTQVKNCTHNTQVNNCTHNTQVK